MKKLNNKLDKLKWELEEKNCLNNSLKMELTQTQAAYKAKIKEQQHIVHHLHNEIENLKEKCGETVGRNSNNYSFVMEHLLKYKSKEEVYKETINKLQENNRILMDELFNLKQNVVLHMCSENQTNKDIVS